ncbi:hypothetical protein [Methylococcus geothermalis]|uniref:Uncharacterized protein n=1 Tax=Methylococcus geothermalis TaxID=2681310 RepID=A0A858Q6Y3_9GAMM|nr:hypothetical protein [Methylococcus geothermalis]QJD29581.1 hypothetical protein GNH96_06085 [Methylococcus geothermalis]
MNAEEFLLALGLIQDGSAWRDGTDGRMAGENAEAALIAMKGEIVRMAFEPGVDEPLSMKQAMEALRLISDLEKR